MSYATVTPDRGDRPQFLEFCIKQLNKLNNGHPMNAYLMNDKPKNGEVDIVPRIRQGIEMAKRDGFTHVYILESDDFYCADYLKTNLDFDFFGYSDSTERFGRKQLLKWSFGIVSCSCVLKLIPIYFVSFTNSLINSTKSFPFMNGRFSTRVEFIDYISITIQFINWF